MKLRAELAALAGLIIIIIAIYVMAVAGKELKIAASALVWVGSTCAIISTCVLIMYWTNKLHCKSRLNRAEAMAAEAEAKQKSVMVVTAPKDHQVMINDPDPESYYRFMHLNVGTHMNGRYETPPNEQYQVYQSYHGSKNKEDLIIYGQDSLSEKAPKTRVDWLRTIVLNAPHIHYCGATRSGKTTLANHHIANILKQDPKAEIFLLNPKDTAARKPFIVPANYTDIGEALIGLENFNRILRQRKDDPNLKLDSPKIVFVIDEYDWIYDTYRQEAVRLLCPLIKVGAELNIQVILIGQSPLTRDTGLSQSLYFSMVRVAIWQEGARLLTHYSMSKEAKAPLKAYYDKLRADAETHEAETNTKLRYCLLVPMDSDPSVEIIPNLQDPASVNQLATSRPKTRPNDQEREILIPWWKRKNNKDFSGNKLHHAITGKKTNVSTPQLEKYRRTIKKYGEEPGF